MKEDSTETFDVEGTTWIPIGSHGPQHDHHGNTGVTGGHCHRGGNVKETETSGKATPSAKEGPASNAGKENNPKAGPRGRSTSCTPVKNNVPQCGLYMTTPGSPAVSVMHAADMSGG